MALTHSHMMPLGTTAPDFTLYDPLACRMVSRDELQSSVAMVVLFICNHCPYVKHIRDAVSQVAQDYQETGVQFVAINSNDVENYPEDGPEKMAEMAQAFNFQFPYLYDETQEVAKAYQAACTPDCYIFDANFVCVYHGQFDDARPSNNYIPDGASICDVLDAMLHDEPIPEEQNPSIGCNIKWKAPAMA